MPNGLDLVVVLATEVDRIVARARRRVNSRPRRNFRLRAPRNFPRGTFHHQHAH